MTTNPEIRRFIKIGSRAAMGVGLIGAFTTDAPALAAIWGTMIYGIAREHEVSFDKDSCIQIATSVITSAAAFMTGAGILVKILTYIPLTTILGVGVNCVINYFYTWRLGNAFDEIFCYKGTDTSISKLAEIAISKLIPIPTISEVKQLLSFINK